MKRKRIVFASCLAAAGLLASPVVNAQNGQRAGRSVEPEKGPQFGSATASRYYHSGVMSRSYTGARRSYVQPRYYGSHRGDWRHHRHGTHYYYYGYPGFGYYPYGGYYPYWGYAPYAYYDYYPSDYTYGYYYGTATHGHSASTVLEVQRQLAHLGYYHGAIDGVIGSQTRSAITAYQRSHGLNVDGTISEQLMRSMGLPY